MSLEVGADGTIYGLPHHPQDTDGTHQFRQGAVASAAESATVASLSDHRDTEPAPAPEQPGALDPTAGAALSRVDWTRVPAEISSEMYYLLAFRCRKHRAPCFCGCHQSTETASNGWTEPLEADG